jgi:prevent-host-death family protein
MRTVGAFDAKNTLGTLLDLVEQGQEVVITRHGKPVARLVAPSVRSESDTAMKVVEQIKAMRKGVTLGGVPIKDLIEEGRR